MNWNKFFHAPIKYMGKIYHSKYHLNYVHARKLFVFDILLLLGTLVLIASTIFWHTYDPTIEEFVELNISATDDQGTPLERIASGEPVRYTITYANTSDKTMTRPQLRVLPPAYFQISAISAQNIPYNQDTYTFTLPDLAPGDSDTIAIDGVYFGIPDEYEHVSVVLSYIQDGRTALESANSTIISSLRDAVLVGSLDVPRTLRGTGSYPITLTLANQGELPLSNVIIPTESSVGSITWQTTSTLSRLDGGVSTTLQGTLRTDIPKGTNTITISITPAIRITDTDVPQDPITATTAVVHPSIALDTPAWADPSVAPGDTMPLSLTITNTGDISLDDITLQLPLNGSIIAVASTRQLNPGSTLQGTRLIVPIDTPLAPGATYSATIPVQLRSVPSGGTDVVLTIAPTAEATAPGGTSPVKATADSTALAVGTSFIGEGHSRYYTDEGDQLGRGPLPPQVGEETKYWALINLQNTTSRLANPRFTATLGPNVRWTGRSSVSLGNDMVYTAETNEVTWSWNSIAASQIVGLYMELAITPTSDSVGTVPVLLENIRYSGFDTYIEREISRSIGTISADLRQDARGQARGIEVID